VDALLLHRIDQRADIVRFIQRRADAQVLHARLHLADEALVDRLLHQQARTGAADLALVEPDRIDQAFDRRIQVGVVEHDERRLAAQFQRQLLAAAGRGLADQAADFGRAGEGQLVDARMVDDRLAHAAIAGDDVDHATWDAGALADLGEQQGGQRRVLGRLEHDSVTGGQRRRDLPCQHQEREVPRHDLAHHANGAVVREFFGLQLGPAGVMVEVARGQRQVGVAGFADGLAIVQRLEHREQARVLLQQARERIHDLRAAMPTQGDPARLRAARGGDGAFDVVLRRLRHLGQLAAVGGIVGGEGRAGLAPGVVDEQAEAAAMLVQPRERFLGTLWCRTVIHGVQNLFDCWHDEVRN